MSFALVYLTCTFFDCFIRCVNLYSQWFRESEYFYHWTLDLNFFDFLKCFFLFFFSLSWHVFRCEIDKSCCFLRELFNKFSIEVKEFDENKNLLEIYWRFLVLNCFYFFWINLYIVVFDNVFHEIDFLSMKCAFNWV